MVGLLTQLHCHGAAEYCVTVSHCTVVSANQFPSSDVSRNQLRLTFILGAIHCIDIFALSRAASSVVMLGSIRKRLPSPWQAVQHIGLHCLAIFVTDTATVVLIAMTPHDSLIHSRLVTIRTGVDRRCHVESCNSDCRGARL